MFIMPPEHARMFHDEGYTLQQVKAAIYEHAALPTSKLSAAVREKLSVRREMGGTADENVVRAAATPDDIMIVVAGGVGRKAAYVPTWGGTTRAVSRAIQ